MFRIRDNSESFGQRCLSRPCSPDNNDSFTVFRIHAYDGNYFALSCQFCEALLLYRNNGTLLEELAFDGVGLSFEITSPRRGLSMNRAIPHGNNF